MPRKRAAPRRRKHTFELTPRLRVQLLTGQDWPFFDPGAPAYQLEELEPLWRQHAAELVSEYRHPCCRPAGWWLWSAPPGLRGEPPELENQPAVLALAGVLSDPERAWWDSERVRRAELAAIQAGRIP